MSVIDIELTDNDLDRVIELYDATEKQVRLARTRALRKTASWLRREVLSRTAKQKRIPARALQGRAYTSKVGPQDDGVIVTIGTMPLDVMNVGNPAQTAKGVRVGRQSYPGAFVQKIFSGQEKVWIRKGSKHYDPARYPVNRKKGPNTLPGELMGRFPVVRAAIPINDVVEVSAERYESLIRGDFMKNFKHELNYEVNVK
ncbi:MAG: hypothetical protein PF442_02860 [Desulfobulbaceae bacterium]|jgi:hypothetical protein|nr:hypothetical protein [Desulfobulbaceae bacterium]